MRPATRPLERRAFGRKESELKAFAQVAGSPAVACVVCNISESGALLEFATPFNPPFTFRLIIAAKGIEVICEVRHRTGNTLGVSLVSGSLAGAMERELAPVRTPAPTRMGGDPDENGSQGRPLPRETPLTNTDLRRRFAPQK